MAGASPPDLRRIAVLRPREAWTAQAAFRLLLLLPLLSSSSPSLRCRRRRRWRWRKRRRRRHLFQAA
eukprot:6826788-Pyramimonas_sp.AAC.1